ncbi:unnamed protein product [Tilletia controversa]|uniref:Uncharacterized protein n=1 Tax=Tilletia controversa TaxID=13291 RepID=A0A8X7MMR1_9BASI|nr:hypothetical protein CF328_g7588 [Tilletia controversa]KAE8241890.1 hypothetical protein A4X06_0g7364 [Tilletia controversa]CAD6947199.1 unnamed protein product [Tilletia controversa]
MTPPGILAEDPPTFISARAANSLLSENRPTRIQSDALHYLNRLLDELLLLILQSSRSLSSNRIKTDGVLKVLNNNLLAKNAVLEAELELRTYLEGKRAEGAKMPLGLQATSRLDGTESFPVASAYNLLRNRCEVYSTLNDHEDDTAAGDQHIMSAEGRPVATITPGVAIYVTALLEFVGEYILQGMARVIERDNSDEASLIDFRAAVTEDEALSPLYSRLIVCDEIRKRMDAATARRHRKVNGSNQNGADDLSRGVRPETRTVRPWQVPNNSEDMEEATNMRSFGRRTSALLSGPGGSGRPGTAGGTTGLPDRGAASVSGHGPSQDYKRESLQSVFTSAASTTAHGSIGPAGSSMGGSTAVSHGPSDSVTNSSGFARRLSNDGKGFGIFGGKRRGSLRQSSDVAQSGAFGKQLSQEAKPKISLDSGLNAEDDFEALMMSGQTMKVSLTPNRLRTIEVPDKATAAATAATAIKLSQRTRPGTGTLNTDKLREADSNRSGAVSPAPAMVRSASNVSEDAPNPPRPGSRAGQAPAPRPSKIQSPPPSSYRGPGDNASIALGNGAATPTTIFRERDEGLVEEPVTIDSALDNRARTFPRSDSSGPVAVADEDVAAALRAHPPSAHQASASTTSRHSGSPSLDFSRRGTVGGVVRNLFGNKRASKDFGSAGSPSLSATSFRDGPYSNGHADAENVASSVDLHTAPDRSVVQSIAEGGSVGHAAGQSRQYAASLDLQERDEARRASLTRRKEVPSINPAIAKRPGTVMGLYGDPESREGSPPSHQQRQEPPSRKVPWSYTRRSSGNLGRRPTFDDRVGRGSTTSVNDPYSSSVDHSNTRAAQLERTGSFTHNPQRDTYGSLPHSVQEPKTPTHAEMLAGSSSAYAAGMVPLALLLDLEQRMKSCTTIAECQALLGTYIEDASAGRLSDLPARIQSSVSTESTRVTRDVEAQAPNDLQTSEDRKDPVVVKVLALPPPAAGPVLAMADEWVLEENTPLWEKHISIAGWLLDGDSSPVAYSGPQAAEPGVNGQEFRPNGNSASQDHAPSSDGHVDALDGPDRRAASSSPAAWSDLKATLRSSDDVSGSERARRPSAVSTAYSNYKDAEE